MSGITGIFYRDGRKVDPELIKKMNDRLSHRGPDGSAVWCEGQVALGHQMLWTTPESLHEKLPFDDDNSGLVITADARIDNRDELSKELDIEDKEEVSDSYFILKAYERWGEDCPDKLLGDFAFAIWDKNKEKLFCARDHMGVKPFYYYLSDEMFVFGTEIKALFCVSEVPCRINELQIAYYLGLIVSEERKMTFYEDIIRLSAAHFLTLNFENNSLKKYWTLDPNYKIYLDSNEEYEKTFRDIFTEAVFCRLRSVYPIGSMLSGGLDSSSVVCTAQNILKMEGKDKLKTFSAIFDSIPQSNERYFIEKVSSYVELDSYYINADKISPLNEINCFLWYSDQPFILPNTFMLWNIYREANKNGVRIVLDGFDGDTTVSHGFGFITELARTMRWKKLIFEIKDFKRIKSVSYWAIFLRIGLNILPIFLKRKMSLWNENRRKKGSNSRIVKKTFANRVSLIEKIAEVNENHIKINNASEKHYVDLKSGSIQFEMELIDWISVPFSIDTRHPFYDKRLIEFCLAIPTEQKFLNGWDRSIMRRAMSEILPSEVQWRKFKGDLSFNFNNSLLNEKGFINELIEKNNNLICNYVDIEKFREIYNQFKSEEDGLHIWNVISLILWFTKSVNFNK